MHERQFSEARRNQTLMAATAIAQVAAYAAKDDRQFASVREKALRLLAQAFDAHLGATRLTDTDTDVDDGARAAGEAEA